MSFAPFIPHPKRQECLTKAGLPSWFDNDPMLMQPQVMLDQDKVKEYYACRDSKEESVQESNSKIYLAIGVVVVVLLLLLLLRR